MIFALQSPPVPIISSLNCFLPKFWICGVLFMKYEVCTWIGFMVGTLAENLLCT